VISGIGLQHGAVLARSVVDRGQCEAGKDVGTLPDGRFPSLDPTAPDRCEAVHDS
jgi:hypothetical protein